MDSCFLSWYFWKPFRLLKSRTRIIGFTCVFQFIAVFSSFLFIYVQQGCYEGCAVMSIIVLNLSAIIVDQVVLLILTPIFIIQRKKSRKFMNFLHIWTAISCVATLSGGIAMAVLTRGITSQQLFSYNIAAFFQTLSFWFAACVDMLAFFITAARLRSEITQSFLNTKTSMNAYHDLERRLRLLMLGSFMLFVVFLSAMLVTTIVISVLGSFPYFYLIFYLEIVIGESCFCFAIVYVILPNGASKKIGAQNSKLTASNEPAPQPASPSVKT